MIAHGHLAIRPDYLTAGPTTESDLPERLAAVQAITGVRAHLIGFLGECHIVSARAVLKAIAADRKEWNENVTVAARQSLKMLKDDKVAQTRPGEANGR